LAKQINLAIQDYNQLKHNYVLVANILNREFVVVESLKAWSSDITYSGTKEDFLYLKTF
jgi:hypothetical protein